MSPSYLFWSTWDKSVCEMTPGQDRQTRTRAASQEGVPCSCSSVLVSGLRRSYDGEYVWSCVSLILMNSVALVGIKLRKIISHQYVVEDDRRPIDYRPHNYPKRPSHHHRHNWRFDFHCQGLFGPDDPVVGFHLQNDSGGGPHQMAFWKSVKLRSNIICAWVGFCCEPLSSTTSISTSCLDNPLGKKRSSSRIISSSSSNKLKYRPPTDVDRWPWLFTSCSSSVHHQSDDHREWLSNDHLLITLRLVK